MGGYYGKINESNGKLSRFVDEANIAVQDKTAKRSFPKYF